MKKENWVKNLGPWAIFAVLSLVLAGCSGSSPVLSFVPEDAVAVIQIKNPAEFLMQSEKFVQGFMDEGQANLAQVLKDWERKSLFPVSGLDLSKPAGAAVLSLPHEHKPLRAVFFFALKDPDQNYPKVLAFLLKNQKKDGGLKSLLKGDYVALFTGFDQLPVLPVAHPFDLNNLKTPLANGIDAYVNLKAVEKDLLPHGETWAMLTQQAVHSVETEPKVGPGMGVLVEKVLNYVGSLEGLTLAASFNDQGLALWDQTHLTPGSKYLRFAQNLQVKGSREFWKYQDAQALASMSWNIPPQTLETLNASLGAVLYKAMGVSDGALNEYLGAEKTLLKATGPRGALNLDLEVNPEVFHQDLSETPPNLRELSGAFNVRITGVQETTDGEAYKIALRNFYTSAALSDLMADLGRQGGNNVNFGVRIANDLKNSGLVYDRAQVWVRLGNPTSSPETEKINEFISEILDNLPIYLHYSPTRVYFTAGKDGLADLDSLVQKDAVLHNWAKSPFVAGWGPLIPDNSLFEGGVSLNKVFQVVKEAGALGFEGLPKVEPYQDLMGELSPTPSGNWEAATLLSLSGDKSIIQFLSQKLATAKKPQVPEAPDLEP
jgi:hypothetical protein